ncbi:protein kinase domain-containing protein [Ningiella sp. W23]|uniref:protein kinase domain-containing protein n=1 Tax=Ningiella sp. W23 TaxID=3023715 RepID=UPI003756474D
MKWFFSIRTKLFAFVFLAFLTFLSLIYWQIGAKSDQVSNDVIERSLVQSNQILQTRIESRFKFISEIAYGIARDGRVLPLVSDQASLTLQDLSLEYVEVYDFDILFFLNANGRILARADDENAVGINLAGRSALFDDALNGELSLGFISSKGKLMQTIAAPIFDNVAKDLVKGVVVLAYDLSHDTAQEIVALTQSQIGFFSFSRDNEGNIDGIELSYMSDDSLSQSKMTYFSEQPNAWKTILESASDTLRMEFLVDGQLQHSVFRRINSKDGTPLGFVVAIRSAEELKRPFKEIQHALLMIGASGLVLASLIALLMALTMSRPIIRLVDITKQIQAGLYPEIDNNKRSKDEIGSLQNALVKMSQSLKEKAEYEAYLAELATEIEADNSLKLQNPEALSQSNQSLSNTSQGLNKVIGERYQLLSQLGSGTMGVVYLAQDLDLHEKVAIKVMQKAFFEGIEGLNVKEEIRLARKITHRNIVRTFDFGSNEDEIFITMEYVQGYDLGRLIKKKGALDISTGLAISKQICSAMIAAHQIGVIHRDLKPGNMIINRQGILKVMDFGLAMQVTTPTFDDDDMSDETQILTEANTPIMGTPRFMAPEQFSVSSSLDERTDIYAIGVIMFTIFNGTPPFSGNSFQQLAYKHCNENVPEINGRENAIPEALQAIIRKALAKDPEDRFQSVRALFDQIFALDV